MRYDNSPIYRSSISIYIIDEDLRNCSKELKPFKSFKQFKTTLKQTVDVTLIEHLP